MTQILIHLVLIHKKIGNESLCVQTLANSVPTHTNVSKFVMLIRDTNF